MSCPINSLPIELLAITMARWLEVDEEAVWMASSVCHHWRGVVLSKPTLWNNIYIDFKPAPPAQVEEDETWCVEEKELFVSESPRGRCRPLRIWLERAGTSELRVRISAHTSSPMLSIALGEMVTILAPQAFRICHLELSTNSSILAAELLTMLWEAVPTLRHLSVLCFEHPLFREGADLLVLWDALTNAPRIQSLDCRGFCPPRALQNPSPALRLSSLVFTDITVFLSQLLRTLESCVNLTSLQISQVDATNLSSSGPPFTVTLPELIRLSVRRISAQHFADFALGFVAPRLRSFTLENFGWRDDHKDVVDGARTYDRMAAFGQAVVVFAEHSPGLESLSLAASPLPDRHLLNVLRCLPHLTELSLDNMFIGAPAFRGLTASTSHAPAPTTSAAFNTNTRRMFICPRLRRFSVASCEFVTGKLLLDLMRVRKRSSDVESISFLRIKWCSRVEESHISSLRRLRGPLELENEPCEIS